MPDIEREFDKLRGYPIPEKCWCTTCEKINYRKDIKTTYNLEDMVLGNTQCIYCGHPLEPFRKFWNKIYDGLYWNQISGYTIKKYDEGWRMFDSEDIDPVGEYMKSTMKSVQELADQDYIETLLIDYTFGNKETVDKIMNFRI